MTYLDEYRRLRNLLHKTNCLDSLHTIWCYSLYLQMNEFKFPDNIDVPQQIVTDSIPQRWVAEWDLEQLAREVLIHSQFHDCPLRSLKNSHTFIQSINKLKSIENEIYGELSGENNIHREIMRIAHRQFIWQKNPPNKNHFFKYYSIFNTEEINKISIEQIGMGVDRYLIFGLGFFFDVYK